MLLLPSIDNSNISLLTTGNLKELANSQLAQAKPKRVNSNPKMVNPPNDEGFLFFVCSMEHEQEIEIGPLSEL